MLEQGEEIQERLGDPWPTFIAILQQAELHKNSIKRFEDHKERVLELLYLVVDPYNFLDFTLGVTAQVLRGTGDGSPLAIICFLRTDLDAIRSSVQMAMPSIMTGDTNVALRRLWFLNPDKSTNGTWNLFAKAHLFGNLSTESSSAKIRLLEECNVTYRKETGEI
jgi:hypothetical protein